MVRRPTAIPPLQHCVFDKVRDTLLERAHQYIEIGKTDEELAAEFSKEFLEELGRLIDNGEISVRLTARLLGITIDDLQDLFDMHNVNCKIGL